MELTRLTGVRDAGFPEAIALYQESFPRHEQREEASQAAIMAHPDYHFCVLREEGVFLGDLLYWELPEMLYVEHFCIRPDLRGRSYGRRALELLCGGEKPVVLEIDPPEGSDIALRRKRFYQRAGFRENPYPHVHPAYHAGAQGHALVVMSHPRPIAPAEYRRFRAYLENTVMAKAY